MRDVKVPEGSVMLFLLGSANRDDRKFPDGDAFDVHREVSRHLTFGNGIHLCMGSALARMEGRIALEELLVRIPEWDIDMEKARLSPTSTVRGWETLPASGPVRRWPEWRQRRPPSPRRYESPVRRQQAIETRERIIAAGLQDPPQRHPSVTGARSPCVASPRRPG